MKITTILFDLDGTLLPMDQDLFLKYYFGALAKKLVPHGYDPELLIQSIWKGTGAMVKNDGTVTNETVFWKHFCGIFGEKARMDEPVFEAFYREDFQKVQASCGYTPFAAEIIALLKEKGLRVILATNPLFPRIATESRIRWAGMNPEDFEWITTYENSGFCKPNPDYYREILDKMELNPSECLMVGNDVGEDMVAQQLGMEVFLVTDCLIHKGQGDISRYPQGSLQDLKEYFQNNL